MSALDDIRRRIQLRAEIQARCREASELVGGSIVTDAQLDAAYNRLSEAQGKIHDLLCARMREKVKA